LYTREDVRRLVLIRRLSNAGVPIGEVAKASLAELERISENTISEQRAADAVKKRPESIHLVIIGNSLATLGAPAAAGERELDVVLRCADVRSAEEELSGRPVDIVVLECPTVHDGTDRLVADAMSTLGARGAIVVYGFGARAALNTLRRGGVVTMRSPLDSSELRRAALGLMEELSAAPRPPEEATGTVAGDVPPPRFTQDMVARIVGSSPSIKCECPHHLAQIVMGLRAFEQYCAECESSSPEDAELHRYLKGVTGRSRAAFEEALARLAEAEGIYLRD
ncbi:MAG TPA: hypothetical protein VLS27_07680, partial [Gammaproteobacteria bacterium]|nr:hypothetical protein [Gammaproteobacteria bacterium]